MLHLNCHKQPFAAEYVFSACTYALLRVCVCLCMSAYVGQYVQLVNCMSATTNKSIEIYSSNFIFLLFSNEMWKYINGIKSKSNGEYSIRPFQHLTLMMAFGNQEKKTMKWNEMYMQQCQYHVFMGCLYYLNINK